MTVPRIIEQHMEVVGLDGVHVGIVDQIESTGEIKLAKHDPDAGGEEHYIPLAWLAHAEIKVHLKLPGDEAKGEGAMDHPLNAALLIHFGMRSHPTP